jgi:hypothetical protein
MHVFREYAVKMLALRVLNHPHLLAIKSQAQFAEPKYVAFDGHPAVFYLYDKGIQIAVSSRSQHIVESNNFYHIQVGLLE